MLARIAKCPAPKQVVRNPPKYAEEVDSLGVGQFLNIQQNAALCSAIISIVHNGAVAVGRCEPRLTHAVSHPLSFAQKKKASEFRCFLFCE